MNPEQLLAICPRCPKDKAELYAACLSEAMQLAKIDTVTRAAAFLGQIALETGELRWMEELSSGEAYEGRADLGNTHLGDGPKFKGRGAFQLTGRYNYHAAGRALNADLETHPEYAALPEYSFKIAAWYWGTRNLNARADLYDFTGITKAINGGLNALEKRREYYHRALEVLGQMALPW